MPKLPQVSAPQLIKALEKTGFRVISQKGSHIKMTDNKGRVVTVPNHKSIKKGTRMLIASLKKHNYPLRKELAKYWRKIAGGVMSGSMEFQVLDPDGYFLRFSQSLGEKTQI